MKRLPLPEQFGGCLLALSAASPGDGELARAFLESWVAKDGFDAADYADRARAILARCAHGPASEAAVGLVYFDDPEELMRVGREIARVHGDGDRGASNAVAVAATVALALDEGPLDPSMTLAIADEMAGPTDAGVRGAIEAFIASPNDPGKEPAIAAALRGAHLGEAALGGALPEHANELRDVAIRAYGLKMGWPPHG
jgi:ADP-ribosylglycohydrolase